MLLIINYIFTYTIVGIDHCYVNGGLDSCPSNLYQLGNAFK